MLINNHDRHKLTIEQLCFNSNINYTPSLAKQNLRILYTLGRDKCLEDLRTKFFPTFLRVSFFSENTNYPLFKHTYFCGFLLLVLKKLIRLRVSFPARDLPKKSVLLLIPLRGKQMVVGIR